MALGMAGVALVIVAVLRMRGGGSWQRRVEIALVLGALVGLGIGMRSGQQDAVARANARWSCGRIAALLERTPVERPVRGESRFAGVMAASALAVRACVPDERACEPLIARSEVGDADALRALAQAMRGERACER